jgi:hypothetical protein
MCQDVTKKFKIKIKNLILKIKNLEMRKDQFVELLLSHVM